MSQVLRAGLTLELEKAQAETAAVLVFLAVKIWGFPSCGVPQSRWFVMENPIEMDDLENYHHGQRMYNTTSICMADKMIDVHGFSSDCLWVA